MGYLYILKQLANACFMGRKYSDAEKFYKVIIDVVPEVTKNPANVFSANKNLLLLYTYTDLDKAKAFADRLQ